MVLPNTRYRAQKQWSAVAFDQVGTDAKSNSMASVSLTLAQTSTIVAACVTNTWSGAVVQFDGVNLTPLATQGTLRLYAVTGVAPGVHSFTHTSGGSWRTIAVAAYTGVSAVSAAETATGTSVTPSVTPAGSGVLAVAGFSGANVDAAGTTSNGSIRAKQSGISSPYDVALVDHGSAPITLTQSSAAWNAIGVWLS